MYYAINGLIAISREGGREEGTEYREGLYT
jgi:hypothetical protein